MELVTISLISIGLAADAFAVSLTSGFAIRNIKLNKALKIALFFGIFQALMPLIGWLMGLTVREFIAGFDHWIAFLLLTFIGGKMIYETLQEDKEDPFNPLDSYTLLMLAIATSIDALATGLGFSVLNMSILLASTIIGFVTFFLCFFGVYLGHKMGSCLNLKVEILGGIILIAVGFQFLLDPFT